MCSLVWYPCTTVFVSDHHLHGDLCGFDITIRLRFAKRSHNAKPLEFLHDSFIKLAPLSVMILLGMSYRQMIWFLIHLTTAWPPLTLSHEVEWSSFYVPMNKGSCREFPHSSPLQLRTQGIQSCEGGKGLWCSIGFVESARVILWLILLLCRPLKVIIIFWFFVLPFFPEKAKSKKRQTSGTKRHFISNVNTWSKSPT